jgi:hypothetical protein
MTTGAIAELSGGAFVSVTTTTRERAEDLA